MTIAPTEPAGSPERPHQAGDGDRAGEPVQRWSAQRKLQAVQRLLRGEPLEVVARSLNVTAARLSQWRERVLAAGAAALKERERDARDDGPSGNAGGGRSPGCRPRSARSLWTTSCCA